MPLDEVEKDVDTTPMRKELHIKRVANGYIISGRYTDDEKQVALLLNNMLDIVSDYCEDKPEQQR
jgi:hypothetical protein